MQPTATTLLRISPEQRERYYEALIRVRDINAFDLMEAHVRAEEEWERRSHYASRIVDCPRAHWYGLKGVAKSNPITLTQAMKFALGSAVGDIASERLEAATAMLAKGIDLPGIVAAAEEWSPQLAADIEAAQAKQLAEPERMTKFVLRPFSASEVPFHIDIPGFAFPIGARIDDVYVTPVGVPAIVELKSSSAFMTQMVRDRQETMVNYLLQAYIYMVHYGLPTELHYWDREWGYPYRFGFLQGEDGRVYFQPGGWDRMGKAMEPLLNGMHPADFIEQRLAWYEDLLKSDEPPGEIKWGVIQAPRDKAKHFNGAGLAGLGKHPTYLGPDEESYRLYFDDSGEIIAKKQAENVEYKTGLCGKYCGYRDVCMKSGGVELKPEPAADFSQWGAPKEGSQ